MVGFNLISRADQKRSMIGQEMSAISGHKPMQMLKRYTHLRAENPVDRLDQIMS